MYVHELIAQLQDRIKNTGVGREYTYAQFFCALDIYSEQYTRLDVDLNILAAIFDAMDTRDVSRIDMLTGDGMNIGPMGKQLKANNEFGMKIYRPVYLTFIRKQYILRKELWEYFRKPEDGYKVWEVDETEKKTGKFKYLVSH